MKEVLNNIRIRDRKDIGVVDDANYTVGKKCKFSLHFILFSIGFIYRLWHNEYLVDWLFQPTFQKNVRTFLEKSTDVLEKKYGRFREKVRTFLGKSTDVFLERIIVS